VTPLDGVEGHRRKEMVPPLTSATPCHTPARMPRCSQEDLPRVLEQQEQLLLAQRRCGESEPGVEACCVFVDGMGQDRPNAGLLGDHQRPTDRVLQHPDTKATSMVLPCHGEPGQDDHGQRKSPHALTDALWGLHRVDLAHGEAEIAGDAVLLVGDDERSGRATGLRLASVVLQPVIQCGPAAVKAFQLVLDGQRLRRPPGHWASQGGCLANRSRRPSLACSGRSSRSIRALAWEPETMNRR